MFWLQKNLCIRTAIQKIEITGRLSWQSSQLAWFSTYEMNYKTNNVIIKLHRLRAMTFEKVLQWSIFYFTIENFWQFFKSYYVKIKRICSFSTVYLAKFCDFSNLRKFIHCTFFCFVYNLFVWLALVNRNKDSSPNQKLSSVNFYENRLFYKKNLKKFE